VAGPAHAAPKREGVLARLGRRIREIPFFRPAPRQANPAAAAQLPPRSRDGFPQAAPAEDHLQWIRKIATEVTQTRQLQDAVDMGDVAGAKSALRAGADPTAVKVREEASPRVADLISVARRVNVLYPDRPLAGNRGPSSPRSAIDQLVQGYEIEGARAYLDNLSRHDVQWLWNTARQSGREDLLRATLAVAPEPLIHQLARTPANQTLTLNSGLPRGSTAGFLHTGIERGQYSEALTHYLGSIPGLEATLLSCVNGQGDVWCRHWASVWIEQAASRQADEPIDYSLFSGADLLSEHYTVAELENRFDVLRASSRENYLVSRDALGRLAADCFARMKDGEHMQMLVCTGNHAMALSLDRVNSDGRSVFAISFYDPNLTTSHVAAEARDFAAVEKWTLDSLAHVAGGAEDYFLAQDGVFMVSVLPAEGLPSAKPEPDPNRALSGWYGGRPLGSPTAVWHLFDYGFLGDLQDLPETVRHLDDDRAVAMLTACPQFSETRHAWLSFFRCVSKGQWDAANLYLKAVQQCSPAAQLRIAECVAHQFHEIAVQGECPSTISGTGQFLAALGWRSEHVAQVLSMQTPQGGSTAYWDFYHGRSENLLAMGQLMTDQNFTAEEWQAVLTPYHSGVPGLGYMLSGGHVDAIEALSTVLQRSPLTSAERVAVVRGPYDADGVRYVAMEAAYRNNQPEALRAYGRLVAACLTPDDAAALMTDILSSHRADGNAMFAQPWGSDIDPDTRTALTDVLAEFSFNGQQARQIYDATGINVLMLPVPQPLVLPRQSQRI
jgi:hypothetical protein